MKKLLLLSMLFSMFACGTKQVSDENSQSLFGAFATESYQQRAEGYDYVTVTIDSINHQFASVFINSRSDLKSPTCELQVFARIVDEKTLEFETANNNTAIIRISDQGIAIETKDQSKIDDLRFYCSGGASIASNYLPIEMPTDSEDFWKAYPQSFELQGISFSLFVTSNFMFNQIMIVPSGLEISNRSEVISFEGQFQYAEMEDLNGDGWPELLAMIKSEHKMSVIGYSVNNGKSMSAVALPILANNDPNAVGYEGQDEIRIVETTLIRRFPLFQNGNATGKYRQLQYKLVDGEASRQFVLEKTVEY